MNKATLCSIISRYPSHLVPFKLHVENYEFGDSETIISVEGYHYVSVIIFWKNGDVSYDLISKNEPGSFMELTRFFDLKYQNEDSIIDFLKQFEEIDLNFA